MWVAGLIWPGDRVDVILTQDMDATAFPGERIASETVLGDLVAQHLGHLSLSVRAISEGGLEATTLSKPVFSKDVSSALIGPSGITVRVIEGQDHKDVVFH
jgi:pilus assembly protein CpaB